MDYDDLLNLYKDHAFVGKGTKLKGVLTGDFAPTRLGMVTKGLANQSISFIIGMYHARILHTISIRQREAKERQEQEMKNEGIGSKESFTLRLPSGSICIGPFKNQELCRQAKMSLMEFVDKKVEPSAFRNIARVSALDPDYVSLILKKIGWKEESLLVFE